jgi:uncharacterized membrane protein YdjX (TVP38/TMEM64 family)
MLQEIILYLLFQMKQDTWSVGIIIGSTLLVGLLLGSLIYFFDLQVHVKDLLVWIDARGIWAPILFILLDIVIVLFLFPGVLITMGAGFIFGVIKGSIYIIAATTIGAVIAFLFARYLFTDHIANYLRSKPRLNFINQLLATEGWKLVLATRLIPFFPFKLSNYLFGLTKFKLKDFFIGTFFGIWPITIFNVYVGSITADLSTLGSATTKTNFQWGFYIFGFIMTIIAVIYVGNRARQALKKYLPDTEQQISTNR